MVPQPTRLLSPDVWDEFVAALERGPTPKHVRAVERAKELARHIRIRDASTIKSGVMRSPHCLQPDGA